jgi:hypothetical protein
MTQPKFAPVAEGAEVRDFQKQEVASRWVTHRPADYKPDPNALHRPNTGNPGPDQGYALHLAERFEDRLRLVAGEHAHDVLKGAVMIALRRASLFGRAPVSPDIELALHLFGYLSDDVPEALVAAREHLFAGVSHDYWQQRDIADVVPEATLRLSPVALRDRMAADPEAWRALGGLHT